MRLDVYYVKLFYNQLQSTEDVQSFAQYVSRFTIFLHIACTSTYTIIFYIVL